MEIREEAPFPGHCTHQNCGQNLVSVGLGWVISGREVQFCFLAHWDSSPEKALAILTEQWWTIYVRGCICWMDALCFCNLSRALSFSVPFSQSEFWEIFPMKAFKSIIKNYRLFKNNYISRIAFFFRWYSMDTPQNLHTLKSFSETLWEPTIGRLSCFFSTC